MVYTFFVSLSPSLSIYPSHTLSLSLLLYLSVSAYPHVVSQTLLNKNTRSPASMPNSDDTLLNFSASGYLLPFKLEHELFPEIKSCVICLFHGQDFDIDQVVFNVSTIDPDRNAVVAYSLVVSWGETKDGWVLEVRAG